MSLAFLSVLVSVASSTTTNPQVKMLTCLNFLDSARNEKMPLVRKLQLTPEETHVFVNAQAALLSNVGGNMQCMNQFVDQVLDYACSNMAPRDDLGNPKTHPDTSSSVSLGQYWDLELSSRDYVGSRVMDGKIIISLI